MIMTSFCGVDYKRCTLQLSGGVHCTREGREYTGLSVSFSILNALFTFGATHPASDRGAVQQPPALPPSGAPADDEAAATCGAPPEPLNASAPNVLLIGDSISMGMGYPKSAKPRCACGAGDCCAPDFRLGYGLCKCSRSLCIFSEASKMRLRRRQGDARQRHRRLATRKGSAQRWVVS